MSYFDRFAAMTAFDWLVNLLDIVVVWFIVYKIFTLIKGTRAVQLLKGIFVVIIAWIVTEFLGLATLEWMLQQVINYGFLAVIIIFQPELRRALEQIGRGRLFQRGGIQEEDEHKRLVKAVTTSVRYMAKRRIGALISIERDTGLTEYIETGIPIQSYITSELLINIFIPNTPLHDGAVIVQRDRIAAAACYLPLSENSFISKELGTRHRAAIGLSEVTDAITVVVSEETGDISLTADGTLYRSLPLEEFETRLAESWFGPAQSAKPSTIWPRRGKRHE